MSRIGNAPITIPEGVEITQSEGVVTVKGKKGELTQEDAKRIPNKINCNFITNLCLCVNKLFTTNRACR